MSTIHELGNALRARRTEMGLSQARVATLSGLSRQTVNQLETRIVVATMAHSSREEPVGLGRLSTQGLNTGTRAFKYSAVSRDTTVRAVILAGGGDDEIRLRERMPALATFLHHEPPLEHDVFGDGERALLEHRADLVSQPVHELRARRGGDKFDAEADLGQRDHTDVEQFKRLARNEDGPLSAPA